MQRVLCYIVLPSLFITRVSVLKEALKDRGTINAAEGAEKKKSSYTVGGNANYYSHYGE